MFSRRRVLFLVLLAVSFVAVAVFLFARGNNDTGLEGDIRTQLVGLPVALCEFETLVSDGKLGPAKNMYWDRLHGDTHLLAVTVGKRDRSSEARFLEAHFRVERGLSTLSPSLKTEVPVFTSLARRSLVDLEVVGAKLPC